MADHEEKLYQSLRDESEYYSQFKARVSDSDSVPFLESEE